MISRGLSWFQERSSFLAECRTWAWLLLSGWFFSRCQVDSPRLPLEKRGGGIDGPSFPRRRSRPLWAHGDLDRGQQRREIYGDLVYV